MFSAMFTAAFQDGDNGIPIRYRLDGKLFNLRRLQAKPNVQTEVLDEFLFADDMASGASTEEKMQKCVVQVSDSYDSYDLTISIKKTEVVYQPAPGKKGKRKVQGVPHSQTEALPRPQDEEETDKPKQAQTKQTYEKHQDQPTRPRPHPKRPKNTRTKRHTERHTTNRPAEQTTKQQRVRLTPGPPP